MEGIKIEYYVFIIIRRKMSYKFVGNCAAAARRYFGDYVLLSDDDDIVILFEYDRLNQKLNMCDHYNLINTVVKEVS
ncbi:MAG: hypothetical protein ACOCRK_05145 [bacterium]